VDFIGTALQGGLVVLAALFAVVVVVAVVQLGRLARGQRRSRADRHVHDVLRAEGYTEDEISQAQRDSQ